MKAAYLSSHYKKVDELKLPCVERPMPILRAGDCLVQISSSGINPSDARGALGYFPNCKLPRIPGRDFAGLVVEGSPKWRGKYIWGTGGKAGLESDGTHAEYAAIPESGLAEIPSTLTPLEAGAQVLPFITAYYGLITRAHIQPKEKVLVIGALGQVGRAAMTLCMWKKCHPIALVRTPEDVKTAQKLGWAAIHDIPSDLSVDVVFNSIGNLHWKELCQTLQSQGRMVMIAALPNQRVAEVNLFEFYRKNQEILGINTLDIDHNYNAKLLNEMREGFESKALRPLIAESVFSLEEAAAAYKMVLEGSAGKRVVLNPAGC